MPDFNIPRNVSWVNDSDEVNKTLKLNVTHDSYSAKSDNVTPSFRAPTIIATSEVTYFDPTVGESLKIEVSIFLSKVREIVVVIIVIIFIFCKIIFFIK